SGPATTARNRSGPRANVISDVSPVDISDRSDSATDISPLPRTLEYPQGRLEGRRVQDRQHTGIAPLAVGLRPVVVTDDLRRSPVVARRGEPVPGHGTDRRLHRAIEG